VGVIFDNAFIKLCVCVIKSNFLSWAIRPVHADPVTYEALIFSEIRGYSIRIIDTGLTVLLE